MVCRSQLGESTKMLRKIEQTSLSVLNMFPDLELALEENEPALAGVFFDMVREEGGFEAAQQCSIKHILITMFCQTC